MPLGLIRPYSHIVKQPVHQTCHHMLTHYQSPGFEPASLIVLHDFYGQASNVLAYGRGVRERSEFYWLKASYFTLKFHPHMVHSQRIELC